MKAIGLMVGSALAGTLAAEAGGASALSPALVWSTVLVWMTMALLLALVVTAVGRRQSLSRHRMPACLFGLAYCCGCAGGES